MSGPTSQLPARPSSEHLRKQAKDLLKEFHAGEPAAAGRFRAIIPSLADPGRCAEMTLADAQFVLAREYGFEDWPGFIRHVEEMRSSGRLGPFERLVTDFLAAHAGEADALERLGSHLGVSSTADRLGRWVRERLGRLPGVTGEPTRGDVQFMVARQYGFESWAKLVESLAQPPGDVGTSRLGLSSSPPFYRIDERRNALEPRPPLSDADWDTIFGVMKDRGVTGLRASSMTDSAMERLSRLDFVTRVNFDGARHLTDDGLQYLARMPQLEELDLSGYHSPITDRGLEVLCHLKELRKFKMCWPQRVTDAGVAHLAACDHLEKVDLLGTRTGDGAIAALAGKGRLRHLKAGGGVTADGLAWLHQLPMFKTWQGGEPSYSLMEFEAEPNYLLFPPVHFTHRGLERLVGLDGLFALNIDGPAQVTAEGLAPLAELPNLGWLGVDPTDDAMGHIAEMPRLRMLMCQDTRAGDAGFVALGRSRSIEYIWGRRCYGLTGRGFAAMATMPALRGLSVSCKNVEDAALSALPRFPALREFMPMDVPDDGFRHVGRCDRLEELWCMYCQDTGDLATGHIADLPRLKTYEAFSTRITDRSLEVLGQMRSLERLKFEYCGGLTNAGLASLAALPRLREVAVEGSQGITRDGFSVLPEHVHVDFGP
jgi:hypothetical protein